MLQRHNPSLVVQQLDDVLDDSALQRPNSSTASSLGNLKVSWMSFAASVPTHDGKVTLIGPDWMTNKGRKSSPNFQKIPHKSKRALKIIRQYHTKDKQQKRQRLMASALRTSAKVGKREELCHTLHKASRRAASTQACPCNSGRLVMQLHEAQHRHGQLRGKRTPGTALSACTLAMVAEIRTTSGTTVYQCCT